MKSTCRFWLSDLAVSLLPVMVLATLETIPPTAAAGSNGWTRIGPESGSTLAISIDPRDRSTLYAGTSVGSFTSGDGGRSWVTSDVPFGILLFDPQDPNILYTRPPPGLLIRTLQKSTDGGRS